MPENNFHIQSIQLTNYRSYTNRHFEFLPGLNCITGENGIGKTNLLDAIYYGCFTRSYFQKSDQYNYCQNSDFLRLKICAVKIDKTYEIVLVSKAENGKNIEVNGIPVEKIAGHLGDFPVVFFAPGDIALIDGSSEERRRLMDGFIGQLDKEYVKMLSVHKKIAAQRKSLFEMAFKRGKLDMDLLQSYNHKLEAPSHYIFKMRSSFSEILAEKLKTYYSYLSGQKEEIDWKYISKLHEKPLLELLDEALQEDRSRCTNSVGIHKDDYEFLIKGLPLKKTGSQGQQKTYLLSLKLAMYDILKDTTGIQPLLILDDIFDKLDGERIDKLFCLISEEKFGQVFLSHTNMKDIADICEKHHIKPHLIEL